MDPNACLERLFDAISEGDVVEAQAAAADLAEWRFKGGFLPTTMREFYLFDDKRLTTQRGSDCACRVEWESNL